VAIGIGRQRANRPSEAPMIPVLYSTRIGLRALEEQVEDGGCVVMARYR